MTGTSPLLEYAHPAGDADVEVNARGVADGARPNEVHHTFWPASLNLSKIILGAGMMVIPKACMLLGLPLGICILVIVAYLTWFTLAGVLKGAEISRKNTFGSVVQATCGTFARSVLQGAVLLNCFGLCVVYLVIMADILVGYPTSLGVLFDIFPALDPAAFYLSRGFILLIMSTVVLSPLVLQSDLSFLTPLNAIGVAAVGVMAGTCTALAITAYVKGLAHPLPLLPDWNSLGGSTVDIIMSMAAVIPLLLMALVCHQSIFAAATVLRPYDRNVMNNVCSSALALCTTLYCIIAITSAIAFGADVQPDLLSNMSRDGMAPIVGVVAAEVLSIAVRLGFLLSLIGSFVGMMYPLRHVVLEIVMGQRYHALTDAGSRAYCVPDALLLLALTTIVAVAVPSIWSVMSFIGSAAGTIMAFIIPAAVILAIEKRQSGPNFGARKGLACAVGALGVAMFVNGFL